MTISATINEHAQMNFAVGRTIRKTDEWPDGIPCLLYDGDAVLCEFPGSRGEQQAKALFGLLEAADEYQSIRDWIAVKRSPVLPEEMAALKANSDRLREAFQEFTGREVESHDH